MCLVVAAKDLPWPLLRHSLASIIGVVSLVVHYQLVVDKVEAIRAGLIWVFDHQTNCRLEEGKKSRECESVPQLGIKTSVSFQN